MDAKITHLHGADVEGAPDGALAAFVLANDYWDGRRMPDGRVAFLIPRLFGMDIAIGAEPTEVAGLSDLYSYGDAATAIAAWAIWLVDGFEGEPILWIRHRPSNRRRPNGMPSSEEVRP
jgi:hypothetical protein